MEDMEVAHTTERQGFTDFIKDWITHHRDGLSLGLFFFAAGALVAVAMAEADPIWIVVILNATLMGFIILQRSSVSEAVSRFRQIVIRELRVPWYETVYSRREEHFTKEKHRLAKVAVEEVLPRIIDLILDKDTDAKVRIVLDSGTTITPLFEELVAHGVTNGLREPISSQIITNNLAGIEVVQKQETASKQYFTEADFTLLGGTPLATYRATTGEVTEQAVTSLLTDKAFVTIGVLTANWLLIGRGHNELSVCARGRRHLEFKNLVACLCDYLMVIVPLGKIFALDSVSEVTRLMDKHVGSRRKPDDKYRAFKLLPEKKEKTFLVTTKRPADSVSPLCVLSAQLCRLPNESRLNFTVEDGPFEFSITGSKEEVRRIELPHLWTRRCAVELFGEVR